jgi:hypothetical protein
MPLSRASERKVFKPSGRCTVGAGYRLESKSPNGWRVSGMLVGVDDSRRRMVCSAERFGQKALGRCCIAFGREQEVDRRTAEVHRALQIYPLALDPDVGQSPRANCRSLS